MGAIKKIIDQVVAELPSEARQLVMEHVRFEVRPRPTAVDLARGAAPDDRGYFYGLRVRGDDEEEDGEVFEADDDDDIASIPDYHPGGLVVIFTGNIAPLTAAAIEEVVVHELAHFLGEGEDEAAELGLGDVDEDGTIVEVEAIE